MPSPSTQDLQHTACNRDTTEKLRLGRVDSRSGGQVYWGAMRGMPPEVARTRSQVLQWLPHSSAEGLFSSIPFPSRDSQEAQGKQHERSLCPRWHQHPLTLGHIPSQTSQASGCKGLVAQSLEEWVWPGLGWAEGVCPVRVRDLCVARCQGTQVVAARLTI